MRKLVLILLLLSACQLTPAQKGVPALPEINVGTSALELSFASGSMAGIYMCQQGEVFVIMKNAGTFDIKDGKYSWILGEFLSPVSALAGEFSLRGKSFYNPSGDLNLTSFKFENDELAEQFSSVNSRVTLQACYPYKTSAAVPICIDPDVTGLVKNKPCIAKPVALSGGQGAPVAVTKVDPKMTPVGNNIQPFFEITIKNLGTGTVYGKELVTLACLGGAVNVSRVDVSASVQDNDLECNPSYVYLEPEKETVFYCNFKEAKYGGSSTFSTVLNVNLEYGYKDVVVWPVTITRLPNQLSCR